jgi:hypothetical protein
MARQFGLGPIQNAVKDIVWILETEADRERNMNSIEKCFHKRKQENCELVICIMDSYWNELRPNIKLNGTVTFGINIFLFHFIDFNICFFFL